MLRRVPAPLAALWACTLVLGLAWTLAAPPFQAPDEGTHIAYLQSVAERGKLPRDPTRLGYASEEILAVDATDGNRLPGDPLAKPPWSVRAAEQWRRDAARITAAQRRDGGGPTASSLNPPGFYAYASLPYYLGGSELLARVWSVRVASALWMLLTVAATWLLAGEVFGPRRELQLLAAGVAGLLPMVGAISATVAPDGMTIALWSLTFWLGVRVLRRGPSAPGLIGLFAAVGVACAVKTPSFALLPGALLAAGIALWRARRAYAPVLARRAAAGGVALLLTLGAWFAIARATGNSFAPQLATTLTAGTNPMQFLSYLWQFYLPRPSFLTPTPNLGEDRFWVTWIKGAWGAFGWQETTLPAWLYPGLAAVSAAVLVAAAVAVWRRRHRLDMAVPVFLGVCAVCLLVGLHHTEYLSLSRNGPVVLQGRYLLPLVATAGIVAAAAVMVLPSPRRLVAVGVALAALATVDVLSLGVVLVRFYAA